MCRFTFYLGEEIGVADLVTRPENSLIHQSTHARERPEPLNGDGFGLVWYVPDDPEPEDSAAAVLISSEPPNEGLFRGSLSFHITFLLCFRDELLAIGFALISRYGLDGLESYG